jgi:hypothetical protein
MPPKKKKIRLLISLRLGFGLVKELSWVSIPLLQNLDTILEFTQIKWNYMSKSVASVIAANDFCLLLLWQHWGLSLLLLVMKYWYLFLLADSLYCFIDLHTLLKQDVMLRAPLRKELWAPCRQESEELRPSVQHMKNWMLPTTGQVTMEVHCSPA